MDEILVNKVLKAFGVKSQGSTSSSVANNQIVPDEIPKQPQTVNRTTDSIIKSYSASQILTAYQLQTDDINTNIANAFLTKGVLPTKEDIEAIRSLINNLSGAADLEKLIDKAVNSKVRNLDSNHPVVKEAIETELNIRSLQKDLQSLKAEVFQDQSVPIKLKLEILSSIDKTQAQLESIMKESDIPVEIDRDLPIQEKLIKSVNESGAKKLERAIESVAKTLIEIKTVLADGVSGQLQKDTALVSTDVLVDELEVMQNKLTSDRKSLLVQIDLQIKELVSLKESILKIGELFQTPTGNSSQNASALLEKKIPEFLNTLNVVDSILAKFGEFISAFPQTSKANSETQQGLNTAPNSAINTVPEEGDNIKPNAMPMTQEPNAKISPEVLPNLTNKVSPQNSLSLLPAQLSNALEAIKSNLETIKGILNQTVDLPASVAVKQLVSILENKTPEFLKMFATFDIDNGEFPELKKIQDHLNLEKNKMDQVLTQANSKSNNLAESFNKTINIAQLKIEIEKLEFELIKNNEIIQSLKKNHESVLKTEAKQVIQQLLEKSPAKSEVFHAFEIRHNPMVELQPTRVEVKQNKNPDEPTEKQSLSFLLDLDLTNVGQVKAQLFSSENIKQINLYFENIDYKNLAIENQSELQSRLREIPFLSQIFFSSALPDKKAELSNSTAKPEDKGDHFFDSIA